MTDPSLIESMNSKAYVISYDSVTFGDVSFRLTMTGKDVLLTENRKFPLADDEALKTTGKVVNLYTINHLTKYPHLRLENRVRKILGSIGITWLEEKTKKLYSYNSSIIEDPKYEKSSCSRLFDRHHFCIHYSDNSGFYVEIFSFDFSPLLITHLACLSDTDYLLNKLAIKKVSELVGVSEEKVFSRIEKKISSFSQLVSFPAYRFIERDSYVITDHGSLIFMPANKIEKKLRRSPEKCLKGTNEKIVSYWVHPDQRDEKMHSRNKKIKLAKTWECR